MARHYQPNGRTAPYNSNQDLIFGKLGPIEDRMIVAETMLHAMWTILSEMGVTQEEILEKMKTTYELRKERANNTVEHSCPNCSKPMQISTKSPFLAKCMYCKTEIIIDPYERYKDDAVQPEEEASEEPKQSSSLDLFEGLFE
ncbi:MAG: SGF11 family protein [Clostridia bacterium]|nr:SGF11 family protein [Clostridia bacterium]